MDLFVTRSAQADQVSCLQPGCTIEPLPIPRATLTIHNTSAKGNYGMREVATGVNSLLEGSVNGFE